MLQLLKSNETRDFKLRTVFGLAEEARKKGVYDIANTLAGYLLAIALADTRSDLQRELFVEVATTDINGDESGATKFDMVVVKYRLSGSCVARIPMRLLTEDVQGRCYRRAAVNDDFTRRKRPRGAHRPIAPSADERRRLEAKARRFVTDSDLRAGQALLHSGR